MTQSMTFIPPAQAEALYDTTADDPFQEKRPVIGRPSRSMEDWDDGPTAEVQDMKRDVAIHPARRLVPLMRK
jgi:hypothetical protein